MTPKPKRLTTSEAADWLDLEKAAFLRLVRAGKIKAILHGKEYRFREAEIERFDREREVFVG